MFSILLRHRRACYYSVRMLKPLNVRLPPLFPGISPYTASHLPIRHPDLFQAYAHIYLEYHALKLTDLAFSDEVFLPDPPSVNGTAKDGLTCVLLNNVMDCNFEMASPWRMGGMMIPDSCIEEGVSMLKFWIENALETLPAKVYFVGGNISPEYFLRVIRAFGFISGSKSVSEEAKWDLYQKLVNVLTATALFRYMRLVLTPLVD